MTLAKELYNTKLMLKQAMEIIVKQAMENGALREKNGVLRNVILSPPDCNTWDNSAFFEPLNEEKEKGASQ